MDNLLSFESFSKRVKNEMQTKLSEEKTHAQKSTTIAFENLLKKFDVSSPAELSEDKKEAFLSELFGNSTVSEAYTTVSGTPKSDAEKNVAKLLNAMAKEYDYPIENAIMATVAAIKKLGYEELVESNVSEAKVNSDEEFKEYATEVLKQAHGKDFDQDKANDTIEGILKKAGNDYGKAVGILTSSLA